MEKSIQLLLALAILAPFGCVDAVCQKCERIRKENARKAKDQNWEFYEDWVDMQKETADADSASVDSEDTEKN